jgi:hypothetical protein
MKDIYIRSKDGLSVNCSKLVLSKKYKDLLHIYSLDGEIIGFIDLGTSYLKFDGSTDYSNRYVLVRKGDVNG